MPKCPITNDQLPKQYFFYLAVYQEKADAYSGRETHFR